MIDFNLFSASILSQKELQTTSAGFEPDQLVNDAKACSTAPLLQA